jgi:hypothetical protein
MGRKLQFTKEQKIKACKDYKLVKVNHRSIVRSIGVQWRLT